jgi:hypothetical protein
MYTELWSERLKGRCHLEDVDVDGRIILKWVFEEYDEKVWKGCIWSG